MRIGVIGSGAVGRALATGLQRHGHDTRIGTRKDRVDGLPVGRPSEVAAEADLVFLAVQGAAAVEVAVGLAGVLTGKVLVDTTNPLEFSSGSPGLFVGHTDSLGERVQCAAAGARVVKAGWDVADLEGIEASRYLEPRCMAWVSGRSVSFALQPYQRSELTHGAVEVAVGVLHRADEVAEQLEADRPVQRAPGHQGAYSHRLVERRVLAPEDGDRIVAHQPPVALAGRRWQGAAMRGVPQDPAEDDADPARRRDGVRRRPVAGHG